MLFRPETASRCRKTPFTTLAASFGLVVICRTKDVVCPLPTETLEEHTLAKQGGRGLTPKGQSMLDNTAFDVKKKLEKEIASLSKY